MDAFDLESLNKGLQLLKENLEKIESNVLEIGVLNIEAPTAEVKTFAVV